MASQQHQHVSKRSFGDKMSQVNLALPFISCGMLKKAVGLLCSSRNQQLLLVAIFLTATAACCFSQTEPGSRSQLALVVAPSASSVNYASRAGHSELTYTLQEPYPAKHTLRFIEETLRSRKWKPLKSEVTANSLESEWAGHEASTCLARRTIYEWAGEWQDDEHNLVRYTLRYVVKDTEDTHLPDDESPAPIQVYAVYMPAGAARPIMSGEAH